MFERHQRIQRREFKDYQPLFMLINSLDIIDEATRRDFVCMQGPVWRRFNEATKGAKHRRITVLFLGDEYNSFEELLLVGCDFVKRKQHRCSTLWRGHPWSRVFDDATIAHLCTGLAGRSVLTLESLISIPVTRCEGFPSPGGDVSGCRDHRGQSTTDAFAQRPASVPVFAPT